MRTSILLIASLCLLGGCMLETGTTTNTTISIDGVREFSTRSEIRDSAGDFDCIKSSSGHCHFLLFVEECAPSPATATATTTATGKRCSTRPLQAFTLATGASRHLVDLPSRLKQCVSHDVAPVAPACLDARS